MQTGRIRILVVDDTETSRELLTDALDDAGYEVEAVASGEVAIECVRKAEGGFDFIIMDQVLLGGMDGIDATHIILQEYPQIRTIVMTIYGEGESSRAALDAGAYRYVFRSLNLEEAVRDVIALIESAKELSRIEKILPESFWAHKICKCMGMAISIVDRTYRVLYANDMQNQVAGGEMRTGGICWVEFHQAFQQKGPCPWCPVRPLFEGEALAVKIVPLVKRGRLQYWQTGASSILDSRGQVVAAVKWGVDVTEREQAHVAALTAQSVDERLEAALDQIRMLGYSRARLYELSEDGTTLLGRKQIGGMNAPITEIRFRAEEDPYSQVTLSSRVPVIHWIGEHGDTLFDSEINREGIEEWLDAPLWTGDGQLVGKISIDNKIVEPVRPDKSSTPRTITDEHFESLLTTAGFAANAIGGEREYRRVVQESEILRKLRVLDADLAQTLGAQQVLHKVVQACLELTGAESGNVRLQVGERLVHLASIGRFSAILGQELPMSQDHIPCVWVAKKGKHHVANQAQEDRHIIEWKRKITDESKLGILESLGSYVSYPLEVRGKVIGVLSLQSAKPDFFTTQICTTIEDFRPRAAVAIENARLYERTDEQLGRRVDELQALRRADEALLSVVEREPVLEVILDEIRGLTGADCALVRLYEKTIREGPPDILRLERAKGDYIGALPGINPLGLGVSGRAAQVRQTIVVNDSERDPYHLEALEYHTDPGEQEYLHWIKSEVATPLLVKGELRGVLCALKSTKDGFLNVDEQLVEDFAGRAAIAIDNALLNAQLERRIKQLQALSKIATRIQAATDSDTMLLLALTGVTAKQGLMFSRAMLFQADESGTLLQGRMAIGAVIAKEAGKKWEEVEEKGFTLKDHLDRAEEFGESLNEPLNKLVRQVSIPIRPESGAPAVCLLEQRAVSVFNAYTDPLTNSQLVEKLGTSSFVAVPLIARDDVLGVLVVDNRFLPAEEIAEEDVQILEAFAAEIALIIHNAKLLQQIIERERLDAWRLFSAGAAHGIASHVRDMRGPLTRLTEGLEHTEDAQKMRPLLDRLEESLYQMQVQIRQFMELAQPRVLEFNPLSVNDLIEEALKHSGVEREGIQVTLQLSEDLPSLTGDEEALRRAFLELIDNARHEILRSNKPEKRLEIYSEYRPPYVRLEFADSGSGVPPQSKQAIFDPGYTTWEESTGVGLAIARWWIEQHSGTVREIGIYGEGARFEVLIPVGSKKP